MFYLYLQIMGLGLPGDDSGVETEELLSRNEGSLLALFCQTDEKLEPYSFDYQEAHRLVVPLRDLLEELGGEPDQFQHGCDDQYSAVHGRIIYGEFVQVLGTSSLLEADHRRLYNAISRSNPLEGEGLAIENFMMLRDKCSRILNQEWECIGYFSF
jgi:hypothetical protein